MKGNGVEYRIMSGEGRGGVTALWQSVFGDDDAFIDGCLDRFAGSDGVFTAQDAQGAAAVLLAAPCAACGERGAYLYALATRPSLRGRGVMSGLMRHAEGLLAARGARFAALFPANEGLFGFYAARGYTQAIALRHTRESPAGVSAGGGVRFSAPCAGALSRLRREFLGVPYVEFDAAAADWAAGDLAAGGAVLAESAGGYAVISARRGEIFVPEIGARGDGAALVLLAAVCGRFGAASAGITLAEHGALLAGRGQVRAAALAKPLCGGWSAPRGLYMRLAMEEL